MQLFLVLMADASSLVPVPALVLDWRGPVAQASAAGQCRL